MLREENLNCRIKMCLLLALTNPTVVIIAVVEDLDRLIWIDLEEECQKIVFNSIIFYSNDNYKEQLTIRTAMVNEGSCWKLISGFVVILKDLRMSLWNVKQVDRVNLWGTCEDLPWIQSQALGLRRASMLHGHAPKWMI